MSQSTAGLRQERREVKYNFDEVIDRSKNRSAKYDEREKKFGRKTKVAVNNGFDVQELILVGGEDEIEEPESLVETDENGNEVLVKTDWINPTTMGKAIKIRENYLNELVGKSKDDSKKTLLQTKKEAAKERLKSKATTNTPWDTDFDNDDDSFDFEDLNW